MRPLRELMNRDFPVQLDVSFKDCDATKEELTKEKANRIRDKFRDANLPIVAISAYTNFAHPNPVRRQANIDYLKTMIRFAKDFGSSYVCSETGTYHPDSDWVWHDKNATEAAYQENLLIIKDIVSFAEEFGSYLLGRKLCK